MLNTTEGCFFFGVDSHCFGFDFDCARKIVVDTDVLAKEHTTLIKGASKLQAFFKQEKAAAWSRRLVLHVSCASPFRGT